MVIGNANQLLESLTFKIPFPGNSTQWSSSDGFLLPAQVLKLVLFD